MVGGDVSGRKRFSTFHVVALKLVIASPPRLPSSLESGLRLRQIGGGCDPGRRC
jgi:hypothetical protein